MNISVFDLGALQLPSRDRHAQRQRLIAHRRARSLTLGPCMRLQFEDELTLRHQIQEVLRAERVTSAAGVQQEIDTYAHLMPDGSQWKATLLIELPDAQQRRRELPQLNEAVHHLYVDLPGQARVHAQANEDLPDRHRARPSATHFLRFAFGQAWRAALFGGAAVTLGCAHDQYNFRRLIPLPTIDRLRRDLLPAAPALLSTQSVAEAEGATP